jgi:hypothetical protein
MNSGFLKECHKAVKYYNTQIEKFFTGEGTISHIFIELRDAVFMVVSPSNKNILLINNPIDFLEAATTTDIMR